MRLRSFLSKASFYRNTTKSGEFGQTGGPGGGVRKRANDGKTRLSEAELYHEPTGETGAHFHQLSGEVSEFIKGLLSTGEVHIGPP